MAETATRNVQKGVTFEGSVNPMVTKKPGNVRQGVTFEESFNPMAEAAPEAVRQGVTFQGMDNPIADWRFSDEIKKYSGVLP